MKLYCWHNPISICYGGSWLVVMAHTVASARKKAKDAIIAEHGMLEQDRLGDTAEVRKVLARPPDFVIPGEIGGVVYTWSE
jgi:hypothetical protein